MNSTVSKALASAKDVEQLLSIYGSNKEEFNENNVALILRSISNRAHMLYKETIERLGKNPNLKELLKYIKENIEMFNEQALTEVVIFMRKLKTYKIATDILTKADERKIFQMIEEKVVKEDINPKLCAQIFYEYALLKQNPVVIFNYLRKILDDPKQSIYLTPFAIMLILQGITKISTDKRQYADFAYKLGTLLESNMSNLHPHQQCALFHSIASLQLHINTSHKRNPQILQVLKDSIETHKYDLTEEDFQHILEGYVYCPHTLDTKLFQYVKNTSLYTISEKPLNLSLDFLINFVQAMAKQREGFKLKKESLDLVSNEILKRVEISNRVKLSTISDITKAFYEHNYKPEKLYLTMKQKIFNTPEKEYTLTLLTNIATYWLKQGLQINDLLIKIYNVFEKELSQRNLEALFKLFYIFTYPNTPEDEFFHKARENIYKTLEQKCKQNPKYAISMIGANYTAGKTEYFNQLHKWAFEQIKKDWNTLSIYDKSNIALNYISVKILADQWNEFFLTAFKDLKKEELASFITTYEHKESKHYIMTDFVLRVIKQSPHKQHVTRKIIDAIINTPSICFLSKRGTPNPELKNLLEDIANKEFELGEEVTHNDILKLHRSLRLIEVEGKFLPLVSSKFLEETSFIEKNKLNTFHLAELAEMISEVLTPHNLKDLDQGVQTSLLKALSQISDTLTEPLADSKNLSTSSLSFLVKVLKIFKANTLLGNEKHDTVFFGILIDEVSFFPT